MRVDDEINGSRLQPRRPLLGPSGGQSSVGREEDDMNVDDENQGSSRLLPQLLGPRGGPLSLGHEEEGMGVDDENQGCSRLRPLKIRPLSTKGGQPEKSLGKRKAVSVIHVRLLKKKSNGISQPLSIAIGLTQGGSFDVPFDVVKLFVSIILFSPACL
jgi:hypothetical protein